MSFLIRDSVLRGGGVTGRDEGPRTTPMCQRGNWRLSTQVTALREGVVSISRISSRPRTITSAQLLFPTSVPASEAEAVQSAFTEYVPFGFLMWRTGLPWLTSVSFQRPGTL